MSLINTMLQQVSSYGSGQPGRPLGGGMPGRTVDDPRLVGIGGIDPGTTVKDRPLGFAGGRPEVPLPPDASSTLFVEGLPANCTRREVARIFLLGSIILFGISFVLFSSPCAFFVQFVPSLVYTDIFRPFVGYKEVRLVSKESRHVSLPSFWCTFNIQLVFIFYFLFLTMIISVCLFSILLMILFC